MLEIISYIFHPVAFVFLCKLFDCTFSTFKSVLLYKNKYFMSSICGTISTIFYLIAIVQMAVSNNIYTIISIGLATFIGSYFPPLIVNRLEKDKLYIYEITSDNLANGKDFADKMREFNIPITTAKIYTKTMEKAISCKIYSQSKATSKLIEDNIPIEFKYNIITQVL